MNPAIVTILEGLLIVAVFLAVLWVVQLWKQEADIVDVGWTGAIGFLAVYYGLHLDGIFTRRMLVAALVIVWSYRLASYLFQSRVLAPGEDGRYQELRSKWGKRAQRNFFVFFELHAFLAVALSLPIAVVMRNPEPRFSVWEMLAMLLWVAAIAGETIADRQLRNFRADPANIGRTCRVGLWNYSRHPNYFFEWLHWWTYVLMSIGIPYWWVTLIGPALMLYLFLKVTGIPPNEARALQTRGDDYRQYQETTSAFFPWFPRRAS